MEKTSKRGKIPQSDWPLIMARYESGETLSSIARTYDCSPPAISYIVSRSKAKPASDSSAQPPAELQLVKAPVNGGSANGSVHVEPMPAPTVALRRDPPAEPRPVMPNGGAPSLGNGGTPNDGAAALGEQRRTLHLSLGGNGSGHAPANSGGNGHHPEPLRQANSAAQRPQPQGSDDRGSARPFEAPPSRNLPPFEVGPATRDSYGMSENRPSAQQPRDTETARRNGSFIGQELRSRVDDDIAAFLAAFDAALAADTHESRFELREATDRLLRAGARTRIELERLEARVPLPSREGGIATDTAAWRLR